MDLGPLPFSEGGKLIDYSARTGRSDVSQTVAIADLHFALARRMRQSPLVPKPIGAIAFVSLPSLS